MGHGVMVDGVGGECFGFRVPGCERSEGQPRKPSEMDQLKDVTSATFMQFQVGIGAITDLCS